MVLEKHEMLYNTTAGATAAARQKSMTAEGPLKVAASQYFAVVLPPMYVKTSGTAKLVPMHAVEYCTLEGYIWSSALKGRSMTWFTLPSRLSTLLKDLDEAGHLDWTPVTSVETLAQRMLAAMLKA